MLGASSANARCWIGKRHKESEPRLRPPVDCDALVILVPRGLHAAPRLAFPTATSLDVLRPWLRKWCRPCTARFCKAGVTANQVTLTSLSPVRF
jgi:hypothetical protein